MRIALALVLFAGCIQPQPDPGPGPDPNGWGTGPGGTGGNQSYGCHIDSDCGGGYVCARDGECLTSSQVRTIHVSWTVHGVAASAASCAQLPHLDISFMDNLETAGDTFGFSPVPCAEGLFTIDKMPTRFMGVELAATGNTSGAATGTFASDGTVSLDLRY